MNGCLHSPILRIHTELNVDNETISPPQPTPWQHLLRIIAVKTDKTANPEAISPIDKSRELDWIQQKTMESGEVA